MGIASICTFFVSHLCYLIYDQQLRKNQNLCLDLRADLRYIFWLFCLHLTKFLQAVNIWCRRDRLFVVRFTLAVYVRL